MSVVWAIGACQVLSDRLGMGYAGAIWYELLDAGYDLDPGVAAVGGDGSIEDGLEALQGMLDESVEEDG